MPENHGFNCLTGFYKPTGGTILLRDQHLEGLPGQQIARMGVVRTFQHVRLFREMTVIETCWWRSISN